MEKMDWTKWEEECNYLKDKYDELFKRLKDANAAFKRQGHYTLISVFISFDGSKKVYVQKFYHIFDAISEIKFNNSLGFRSYLKYEILLHRDI